MLNHTPRPLGRTYTVPQAAKILQFNIKKIYKLLQTGELYGKKTDDKRTGRWRIPDESLRKYLAGYQDTSPSIE